VTKTHALLDKAERSFRVSESLLQDGNPDFAASRTYYGYFYIAEALLLTQGCQFSSHGQVVAQYGLHFAQTEKLDRRFHQLLLRAFRTRTLADYQVEVPIDPEAVDELIQGGFEFLRAASRYLEGPSRDSESPDEEPPAEAESGESGEA
jgi:uncharacterized protein (UPF0332 family)